MRLTSDYVHGVGRVGLDQIRGATTPGEPGSNEQEPARENCSSHAASSRSRRCVVSGAERQGEDNDRYRLGTHAALRSKIDTSSDERFLASPFPRLSHQAWRSQSGDEPLTEDAQRPYPC